MTDSEKLTFCYMENGKYWFRNNRFSVWCASPLSGFKPEITWGELKKTFATAFETRIVR